MRWTAGATGEPVHPLSASQSAAISKLLSAAVAAPQTGARRTVVKRSGRHRQSSTCRWT